MNWAAIGAIAELLGAVGVILSVAYLALQVRHNTHQMRLNAESLSMAHEMGGADLSISVASHTLADPAFAELVRRARDGDAELSPADRIRWGTYLWCSLLIFQAGYQNHRKGLVDTEAWEGHARNLTALLDCAGGRAWWTRNRYRFSVSFAEYVEAKLGSVAP